MEISNDTISRDLRRREGVWVLSELTTRRRNEVQHYRRQDKIACYRNGRLQVEERRANPAVDSRKNATQGVTHAIDVVTRKERGTWGDSRYKKS